MVKFSKQYEAQLVPEWKYAFLDYCKLKKDIKKFQTPNSSNTALNNQNNSLQDTILSSLKNINLFGQKHKDHEAIQVHKKLASSASNGDLYETELLEQFTDADGAKEFFACLDMQLNKVNKFYRTKEKEFLDRGDSLKDQLRLLIEARKVSREQNKGSLGQDCEKDRSISCTISCEDESFKDRLSNQGQLQENGTEEMEKQVEMQKNDGTLSSSFDSQGKSLRLNIPLTTPSLSFSAINYLIREDSINKSSKKFSPEGTKFPINRRRLRHAEKMIRGAFVELHKGLGYLNTYRNLNMLAFIKILKKFDKVTGKHVLPIYIKVVETSYFNMSDKAMKLSDEVEEMFIRHFAQDDKRNAMKFLKPLQRKESHGVTFLIGLFTGCFIALLVGYVIMARITGMYKRQPDTVYMETVYPLLSMFGLLFLHLFLYGCNIFAWQKARINYNFILELAPTKELKYRDVFLICTVSMTAVMGVMFLHLSLHTYGYSYRQVQAIPGLLLLAFLLLLVCPLNIIYRSSRYRFISVIRNIIFSPLYKVVMLDFFMADQLCSQIPMLRNLEYVACYYITGSYKTQDYGYCTNVKLYRDLAYAVSFLPYYWRAMQCARRWFDEGNISHLVNLGKYVSAMLAAGAKVAYEKDGSLVWLCAVVVMSSAATLYQLYWDFVKDWGLLQMNSKNIWLRNELMLRRKIIYYFSMGLNLILRLAWLQTVIHSNFEHVDYRVTGLFLAALEVIRRGQWNFYRLENEHLNNAGKFRAVKVVPLPFHIVTEED